MNATTDDFESERQEKRKARADKRTVTLAKNVRRSLDAADALGAAGSTDLNISVLLHELPADRNVHWIRFVLPCGVRVAVDRRRLRAFATEFRRNSRLKDARASVDEHGLIIRWGGGRGGINFRERLADVLTAARDDELVVAFSAVARSAA